MKRLISLLILLLFMLSANAEMLCVLDLDGDGKALGANESASCVSDTSGDLCPIDSVDCTEIPETCPLDPTLSCNAGTCDQPQACIDQSTYNQAQTINLSSNSYAYSEQVTSFTAINSIELLRQFSSASCTFGTSYGYSGTTVWVNNGCRGEFRVTGDINRFQCNVTGAIFTDQTACDASCIQTAACSPVRHECPLGNSFACINNSGTYQCSTTACFDSTTQAVSTPVDTKKLINDGARNPDGSCAEEINIFSGKNSTCMTDGVISAFRNCCTESDGVIQDDYTGTSTIGLVADTASLVYTASGAAWAVYDTALAAGATTAEAGAAASSYFTEVLIANGATLAIGVGVALAAYYYANACDKEDLTTGMLAASKMCHFIGYNCTDRWLGSCVQEERVYCCFNTKIGRIVHEQGRPQLKSFANNPSGIWGSPDTPNCRGFVPAEFQALDFSRIDLSEYYVDVASAANTIDVNQVMTDKITSEVNAIQP